MAAGWTHCPVLGTDHGAVGSGVLLDHSDQGGSARTLADTTSLSSWFSMWWELQHVASVSTAVCFGTKGDTNTMLEHEQGFTACFAPPLH